MMPRAQWPCWCKTDKAAAILMQQKRPVGIELKILP